ncbi:MAG: lytic transglycosylase domain-containing protein [Candidatus Buchananbacteria bacterium]|jgi:hypothetical protein
MLYFLIGVVRRYAPKNTHNAEYFHKEDWQVSITVTGFMAVILAVCHEYRRAMFMGGLIALEIVIVFYGINVRECREAIKQSQSEQVLMQAPQLIMSDVALAAIAAEEARVDQARLVLTDEKIIAGYANFIRMDNPSVDEATAMQWAQYYFDKENELGLGIGILPAIGNVESNHRRKAKSNKEAYGIMQLQIKTAREWAKRLNIHEELKIKMKKLPEGASQSQIKKAQAELEKKRADAEKELVRIITKPKVNITLGAKVLDCYLQEAGGDLDKALNRYSYNATDYPKKVAAAREKVIAALHNAV